MTLIAVETSVILEGFSEDMKPIDENEEEENADIENGGTKTIHHNLFMDVEIDKLKTPNSVEIEKNSRLFFNK
jgi:hypothetical protein